MEASQAVGTVEALWRFPVKSMLGERVEEAEAGPGGVAGDRAYALVDTQTGKVVSAKHPKLWPGMLACRAGFLEEPRTSEPPPAVQIELADGTAVRSDAPGVDAVLSRFFGRSVELSRVAPDDFTIDQYHPDQEGADPEGHRDEVVETSLGSSFWSERGLPSAVPEGSFFDLFPFSVLTTSTLEHLSELEPESRFDARRFRMNVIVDATERGFVENGWIGRTLGIGTDVRLNIAIPDPRCVMPNLGQEDLPRDPKVLKSLAKYNRLEVAGAPYPCAGVYAVAEAPGTMRTGDGVILT